MYLIHSTVLAGSGQIHVGRIPVSHNAFHSDTVWYLRKEKHTTTKKSKWVEVGATLMDDVWREFINLLID